MVDQVSDMIVRLKNAQAAGRSMAVVPCTKLSAAIADLLKAEGYIKSVAKKGKRIKKTLEIELVYGENGAPKIKEVKRVSKPSCRIYHRAALIRPVRRGFGLAVYSTPKGVLSDRAAREQKVGGEALFQIW